MSEIDHYIISKDGVNETGTNSEGIEPDRYPVGQYRNRDRHPATAEQQKRFAWSKEDKELFECYIRSEPESRGYQKRLFAYGKNATNRNYCKMPLNRDCVTERGKLR